jgi:hypothetical protein
VAMQYQTDEATNGRTTDKTRRTRRSFILVEGDARVFVRMERIGGAPRRSAFQFSRDDADNDGLVPVVTLCILAGRCDSLLWPRCPLRSKL